MLKISGVNLIKNYAIKEKPKAKSITLEKINKPINLNLKPEKTNEINEEDYQFQFIDDEDIDDGK